MVGRETQRSKWELSIPTAVGGAGVFHSGAEVPFSKAPNPNMLIVLLRASCSLTCSWSVHVIGMFVCKNHHLGLFFSLVECFEFSAHRVEARGS